VSASARLVPREADELEVSLPLKGQYDELDEDTFSGSVFGTLSCVGLAACCSRLRLEFSAASASRAWLLVLDRRLDWVQL
jgi:hypothetical protein